MLFAGSSIKKSKPFTPPSYNEPLNAKSKSSWNKSTKDLCNRSFDTAQNLLNKSEQNLKQTTLCFRNKPKTDQDKPSGAPSKSSPAPAKPEFFLMPPPITAKTANLKRPLQEIPRNNDGNSKAEEIKGAQNNEHNNVSSNPMEKNGRDKLVITGKVDFCLKIHKIYSELNILWEVFGKVLKIISGKIPKENILILRSPKDIGPVIQSIYYDVSDNLSKFPPGTSLRAIGEFISDNRLRTFHLEQYDCANFEEELSRIQNVTSFSLMRRNSNQTL